MIVICHPGYGSWQIKPLSNFSFFTLSSHDDLVDVDPLILFKENTNWKLIFFSVSELEPELCFFAGAGAKVIRPAMTPAPAPESSI